ncbi:MAG: response regulator [Myxococcales bacterium]|nr:response regulator [Myxococcales bacterium]
MSGNKRRKKRILIVDDDELMRELLEKTLVNAGFRASSVPNGLKLVACLEVARPDLILLDIHMSWIDGFELCRLIHQMPEYRSIPIIFISGRHDDETIKYGRSCGAVDFIAKPFDLIDLIRRVKIHLRLEPALDAQAVNAD